jgi:hypothetical protein
MKSQGGSEVRGISASLRRITVVGDMFVYTWNIIALYALNYNDYKELLLRDHYRRSHPLFPEVRCPGFLKFTSKHVIEVQNLYHPIACNKSQRQRWDRSDVELLLRDQKTNNGSRASQYLLNSLKTYPSPLVKDAARIPFLRITD